MTINHPASDDLLLAYAAGQLSAAPGLVVAGQATLVPDVGARLRDLEQLGGALLDTEPMAAVSPGLLDAMLARLDEAETAPVPAARHDHGALGLGIDLPGPIAARLIGNWRDIAPGIRTAVVDVPEDPLFKVILLRAEAGAALRQHGHAGVELTLVLKGHFSDEVGRFGPGDIEEADDHIEHQPKVDADEECICLIVSERLRSRGNAAASL